MLITNGMYLSLCVVCPAESLMCTCLVLVYSKCSLEVLENISGSFRCRKLALNRDFLLVL